MLKSPEAAMLQGWLTGACMRPDIPLKVTKVETQTDEQGYLDYFDVTLFSGKKVRVHVEPLE